MAIVIAHKRIYSSIETVFECWNEGFGDVYKFHPALIHSRILDSSPVKGGLGAIRQCDMKDGKNWAREEIIKSQTNKQIVIKIIEATVPLKTAIATFDLKKVNDDQTAVRLTMDFEPKMGLLGKMMLPMMKKQFGGMLQDLLDANAAYLEKGIQVNETRMAA